MIIGIGTDIIEVERIKRICEEYGKSFINRIYTPLEQKYCESFNDQKYLHYAARFAVKESFSKAIGSGLTHGFKFKEVSIINKKTGKPLVVLDGKLQKEWSQYKIYVSLSHTEDNAIAFLIIEE